jgi:polysaccharide pyruvyl transferase WcaK-like protein
METLNILHVASFNGNIGDNANHTGFRKELQKALGKNVKAKYEEFEIREVFWKKIFFDYNFVEYANTFDLVVVGGGNYFELWVDDSATGTSIDIALENLEQIKVPLIFNALGVDPAQGASELALTKFRRFLDYCIKNENFKLSCRNDGSIKALKEIVGEEYASSFWHVPDAGFFTSVVDSNHPELSSTKKNVVVQIAGDMLDVRFSREASELNYAGFLEEFSKSLIQVSRQEDAHLIFVPHIFRDIGIIDGVIEMLPDDIRRQSISVAPYLIGQKGQDYIFDLYKKADLVLGMRFHANVCGIGLGTPTIGLINYRQIEELYSELGIGEYSIDVRIEGFSKELISLSTRLISNPDEQNLNRLKLDLEARIACFHNHVANWLKRAC